MNNILNKIAQMERNAEEIQLASQKVDLGKHEVSLATIDEISNQLKITEKDVAYFNKLDDKVQKNFKVLNDAYVAILMNKDYKKKREAILAKLEATITKQAADLGIDVKQLPAWKNLMDAYEYADQVNDSIINAIDIVKTLGK